MLLAVAVAAFVLPTATASAAGWAPAADIASGPTPVTRPQVVDGPDGSLVATYLAGPQAGLELFAIARPANGAWSAPVKLSGGGAVNASTLTADASGGAVATWLEGGFVRAATLAPGGAWQVLPTVLSGSGVGSLSAATTPSGTTGVAWLEADQIRVAVRPAGGGFGAAATVTSGATPHTLSIAAGPQGDLMLAWGDSSGASSRVMTAYRAAAAFSFATPVAVISGTAGANQSLYYGDVSLAFDSAGEPTVAFLSSLQNFTSDQTFLGWLARSRSAGAGGAWYGVVPQSLESATYSGTNPLAISATAIAGDAGGRTTVAFESLNLTSTVYTATRHTAGGFGAPVALTALTSSLSTLSLTPVGARALLLDQRSQAGTLSAADGTFGPFDQAPFAPKLTIAGMGAVGDPAGDAAVLWSSSDGTTYRLRWTAYDVTAPEARALAIPPTATTGQAATFSVTPWDALSGASATWDFGDGSGSAGGASVTHAFASAGTRTVTVTVTDGVGNVTTSSATVLVSDPPSTGDPASPTAVPPAVKPTVKAAKDTKAPVLTALKLAHKSAKRGKGTTVSWKLSEAATVRVAIATVPRKGHKRVAKGTTAKKAKAGAGKVAVGKKLARGRYRLTVRATDAAGNVSKALTLAFTVR